METPLYCFLLVCIIKQRPIVIKGLVLILRPLSNNTFFVQEILPVNKNSHRDLNLIYCVFKKLISLNHNQTPDISSRCCQIMCLIQRPLYRRTKKNITLKIHVVSELYMHKCVFQLYMCLLFCIAKNIAELYMCLLSMLFFQYIIAFLDHCKM